MTQCDAVSVYCSGEREWTFHCAADEGHEPGQHTYVIDDGQPPLPTPGG